MGTANDLQEWMASFVRSKEANVKPDASMLIPHISSDQFTTHYVHPPMIAVFNGDSDQKGVPYNTWKFEILTLLKEGVHSSHVITTAAKGHLDVKLPR